MSGAFDGATQRLRKKARRHPGETGGKEAAMAVEEPDGQVDESPEEKPAKPKTFTQEQVEQMIRERLSRAKSSVPDDYEEAKAKAEKYDEEKGRESDELSKMSERIKELEDANKAMRHAADVSEWTRQAAEEAGVPASVLRGDTLEELREHAMAVKAAIPGYPSVSPGKPADGKMTRAEILAIENPRERKAAMLENIELF